MKARLYGRVSPKPETADPDYDSVDRQFEDMRKWCADNGHEIAGEYFDRGVSGSKGMDDTADRPGLWDAMRELKRGEILVVKCWDRLARSQLLAEFIHHEVKKRGGRIVSIENGAAPDTPESTLIRQILQAIAEFERHLIRSRTKAAMKKYQAHGRRMGSIVPYGMMPDPEDRQRMVENPQETAAIARMLELREKGHTYAGIDEQLRAEGFMPRDAEKWHVQQIRRILARA